MTERKRKSNEPHDRFIKEFVPVVLKNLFESQTSVSVQLSEELLKDDIIEVSVKYCIYLEVQPELTEEDLSFMTYVKEIEVAYQEWVKKRQAEGMIKSANTMVRSKFGVDALTLDVSDRLSKLDEQQLDEFTSKIFEWQDFSEMIAWLENSST